MPDSVTVATTSSQRQPVPEKVTEQYQAFQNWQRFWFGIHYSSGVAAVVAGCLATAAGAQSGIGIIQSAAWIWGLLTALLSGVVTFLGDPTAGKKTED